MPIARFDLFRSRESHRRLNAVTWRALCLAAVLAMTYLMIAPRPGEISPIIRSLRQQFTGGYVLHIAAYCMMSLAGFWMASMFQRPLKHWVIAVLTLHAIASEVAQIWIPTRSWDLWDIACNLTGILAGLLIFETIQSVQAKHPIHTSLPLADR